jgi:hypothetical protein
MTALTLDRVSGLNMAFNEARFLALDFDPLRRSAIAEFSVLALPEQADAPSETPVALRMSPVGRISACYVDSPGNVSSLRIDQLAGLVASFGGRPVYGWEFFDPPASNIDEWSGRLSLDFRTGLPGMSHNLHLFQDADDRSLDLCLWFDELEVQGSRTIEDLIAGGKRWWDAVGAGDPRTVRSGIEALKGPTA